MNKSVLAIFCAALLYHAQGLAKDFRLDLEVTEAENDVDQVFAKTRALLRPEERELLEEIYAADEVIMERQKRGIVDQILAAISGVANGGQLIGSPSQSAAAPAATAAPVSKSDITTTAPVAAAAAQQPAASATQPAAMQNNENHLYNQISKVILTSTSRNVTGIVDEALKIGTPAPVRDLVNGILGVAYCNGIRRLLGRC